MTHTNPGASLKAPKKIWNAPVIQAIDLNSAKDGTLQHGDGPGSGKS